MQAGNQEDGARLLVPGKMEAGAMGKTKACRKLQVLLVSGSVPALGPELVGSSSGGTSILHGDRRRAGRCWSAGPGPVYHVCLGEEIKPTRSSPR